VSVKITEKDVEKIADLAKLELSTEESQSFTQALQARLEQLEVLKEVDTSGVEPLVYVLPSKNVFREDRVGKCLMQEKALANTSEVEDGCFKVPRIV
jgi:aspartyl-tRNA(Asn)/glutamyl-tRNA(Gln) amidotransferase subunit C